MTKGQEITKAWRKASTEQGHRPGTYQYDADLATRIDAAIAEAEKAGVLHGQGHVRIVVDGAIAEEREGCARVAENSEHEDGSDCNWHCNAPIAAAIRARGGKP